MLRLSMLYTFLYINAPSDAQVINIFSMMWSEAQQYFLFMQYIFLFLLLLPELYRSNPKQLPWPMALSSSSVYIVLPVFSPLQHSHLLEFLAIFISFSTVQGSFPCSNIEITLTLGRKIPVIKRKENSILWLFKNPVLCSYEDRKYSRWIYKHCTKSHTGLFL